MVCKEAEKKHYIKIAELQEKCKQCSNIFQELDGHLDGVATKVVYLGDQLEGINTPRSRAEEAQKLMKQFSEFLKPTSSQNPPPIDSSKLFEEADVIQKLHLISQELPGEGKFKEAKKKIFLKYDQVERELIEEFVIAQRNDDKQRMKEIARILSHFKGYSQCMDAFIENFQSTYLSSKSIFNEIVPLCLRSQAIVNEVFNNPEQVMSKFVLNIFYGKLQEYIQQELDCESNDSESYLKLLHELFSKTDKLAEQLNKNKIMGSDTTFLTQLTKSIFNKYLQTYMEIECRTLRDKLTAISEQFYETKNHQKRQIPTGSIQELKRDIQVKIGRANINIGHLANLNLSGIEAANSSETFLSEEIAISILQETRIAFQRCEILLKTSNDLPNKIMEIFEILLTALCTEHIEYALDLGLQSIPPNDPKTAPEIKFFEIARQCNAICHLLEKQFVNSILPLVMNTPKYGECLKRKRDTFDQLEFKINTGLEKCLSSIIGWIKFIMQTEQKKTDFKPETETIEIKQTSTCVKVVRFLKQYVDKIRDCLDGKNVEAVLTELGTRFHRVIYEHLLQFQYSSFGAMFAICDVNEYRKCASEFKLPLLNKLFDTLHALTNLLIVDPKNLKVVSTGEQLVRWREIFYFYISIILRPFILIGF